MRKLSVFLTCICFISTVSTVVHDLTYKHKIDEFKRSRTDLIESIDSVIRVVAPTTRLSGSEILYQCEQNDVDLFFVLAQGQLESHFGTRGLASKTNSVFNVLAYDGKRYDQICQNGKYDHPDLSIEPYIKLLKTRYLVDGKTEIDLLNKFVDGRGHRYASNPRYERDLSSIYRKYTKIDSLVNKYNSYKQLKSEIII